MNVPLPSTDDIIRLLAALDAHPFATQSVLVGAVLIVLVIRFLYPRGRK